MFIETYNEAWLARLDEQVHGLADGVSLYLLIDSVFVPGLHRQMIAALGRVDALALLFDALPGCTEDTKSVSPFLLRFEGSSGRLPKLLNKCSGWPMVSAIETTENIANLTERLSAWCIVEADDQRFNFRFPDTRRLPAIFNALTVNQRAQLAGPATRWSYMARDGEWAELDLPVTYCRPADRATLDAQQFATLVSDSETDEAMMMLLDRGLPVYASPMKNFLIISVAHRAAAHRKLDAADRLVWCEACLLGGVALDETEAIAILKEWQHSRV
ncbi:MAG: DUF4123 domain-containing protein [Pseudomonadota bacterium]